MRMRTIALNTNWYLVALTVTLGLSGWSASADEDFGTIDIDRTEIPRIAPVPVHIDDQDAVDGFFAGFKIARPIEDFDTAEAAEASVDLVLTRRNGKPVRLGKVAYVRPGLGNIMFSPAWVYLLAQHFDRVVLMYTNMTEPAPGATALRRVHELEGVPIPDRIRRQVKIFAIGSPELDIISFLQQSDVFLEQLEIIRRSRVLGGKHLAKRSWVFAHSQGVNDVVLTDHRLRSAGLRTFEHIVAVAAAVKGGRLLGSVIGPLFVDGAFAIAGEQGGTALAVLEESMTVDALAAHLEIPGFDFATDLNLDIRLILRTFAAFGGVIDPTDQGNVSDTFFGLTGIPDADGEVLPNDGAEDFTSTTLGRINRLFDKTDHILMSEDPKILRVMLEDIHAALESEEDEGD